jgi:hypothetical protein
MSGPVYEFLTNMVRLQTRRSPNCRSLERFVLSKGVRMVKGQTKIPRMTVGHCFHNAFHVVIDRRYREFREPELIYCEGYAFAEFFPMLHAWVIDHNGHVIHPTWKDGLDYFGVAVKTPYLRHRIRLQDTYGLIDQPAHHWPLLNDHPKQWAHPIMKKLNEKEKGKR